LLKIFVGFIVLIAVYKCLVFYKGYMDYKRLSKQGVVFDVTPNQPYSVFRDGKAFDAWCKRNPESPDMPGFVASLSGGKAAPVVGMNMPGMAMLFINDPELLDTLYVT